MYKVIQHIKRKKKLCKMLMSYRIKLEISVPDIDKSKNFCKFHICSCAFLQLKFSILNF